MEGMAQEDDGGKRWRGWLRLLGNEGQNLSEMHQG